MNSCIKWVTPSLSLQLRPCIFAHPHTFTGSSLHKLALKIKRQNMWHWKHPIWPYTNFRINSILSFQISSSYQKITTVYRNTFWKWHCFNVHFYILTPKPSYSMNAQKYLPREKSPVLFHSHMQITPSTPLSNLCLCTHYIFSASLCVPFVSW